uniref:HAT C-terminal dimerisation domain-containing protein n=1 Tax=Latimeria chalumnae TaxID=7897 RepID=H3A6X8_LATCH
KLAMFGNVNIATQLDKSYQVGIRKHNEEVDKNQYILSKLVDCVCFCGAFELALRGHDETESSLNPGMFQGLVDLVSSIDSAMEKHVKTATVFKGTSKTIQNELLDCMLEVTRDFIIQQLRNTEYVAIQADDTTDVSTKCQSVLVYRYIDGNGKIVERFCGFTQLKDSRAESIATEHCEKHYDGASVMHGESGRLQRKLNLIMEQAVSKITQNAGRPNVPFLSFFFYNTMPHVDVLYSQLQKRDIDTIYVERVTTELVSSINKVRESIHSASGAMALFRLFLENNLQDTFSETVKLLRILITTPMTTVESERCFSTLKRIKTLRNMMNQDRLNALAMLSMEKQLIQEIPNFNKRTIEKFAALKDRHAKFLYK